MANWATARPAGWRRAALALLVLAMLSRALAEERTLVLLPVYSRPAVDLVPVLQPLIAAGGSLAAHGDRLVVRGTQAELAAVRAALASLDRPPRRLLIEVRHSTGALAQQGMAGGATRVYRTQAQTDGVQQVQTIDGRAARIGTGELHPTPLLGERWPGGSPIAGIEYREFASGFYALPRVHGGAEVTVEIHRAATQPRGDHVWQSNTLATTVRGRLGDWLDLGAWDTLDADEDRAVRRWRTTDRARQGRLELRVRALD